MSIKPSQSAIPPVLAPPQRELPQRPSRLTWLCLGSMAVGALGLLVFLFDSMGLLAAFLGPNLSPPSTRIAPLVKLDQEKQEELHEIRRTFFVPNLAMACALLAKSAALLIGGFAAMVPSDWGRRTLSWTFRLGGVFLLLWIALYAMQTAYEVPIIAKYHQLERDLAARGPAPFGNALYFTFSLGWLALVITFALAQAACFYFGWGYLDSDETADFFAQRESARSGVPEIVFEEETQRT